MTSPFTQILPLRAFQILRWLAAFGWIGALGFLVPAARAAESADPAMPAPLFQVGLEELLDRSEDEIVKPPPREPKPRQLKMALIELPLLILPVCLFYFHPAIRPRWRQLPRGLHAALGLFFACTVWFQATTFIQFDYPNSNEPFPFTRWAMFGGSRIDKGDITLIDFCMEDAKGNRTVVRPPDLIETPAVSVQHTKVVFLAGMLLGPSASRREFARLDLGYFCEGLARSYQQETGETVHKVHVWRRKVGMYTPLSGIPARGDPAKSLLLFTLNRQPASGR
ncbi:MAG TPA: hypothetical protein VHN79_05245 [Lacunisphaera sp.]|nr:hypothetical protein [Lacunisphaera sp.]